MYFYYIGAVRPRERLRKLCGQRTYEHSFLGKLQLRRWLSGVCVAVYICRLEGVPRGKFIFSRSAGSVSIDGMVVTKEGC